LEADKGKLINVLSKAGYRLRAETAEVLHFDGAVRLDILLARRPVAQGMLARAKPASVLPVKCTDPEDIIGLKIQAYSNDARRALQDKADIQFLLTKYPDMDMERIKMYADLFGQWPEIQKLKGIS
jgi:hypothetical protein